MLRSGEIRTNGIYAPQSHKNMKHHWALKILSVPIGNFHLLFHSNLQTNTVLWAESQNDVAEKTAGVSENWKTLK